MNSEIAAELSQFSRAELADLARLLNGGTLPADIQAELDRPAAGGPTSTSSAATPTAEFDPALEPRTAAPRSGISSTPDTAEEGLGGGEVAGGPTTTAVTREPLESSLPYLVAHDPIALAAVLDLLKDDDLGVPVPVLLGSARFQAANEPPSAVLYMRYGTEFVGRYDRLLALDHSAHPAKVFVLRETQSGMEVIQEAGSAARRSEA